jgi:DNA repair exonuclease SbcCD ATPase subunit
MNRTICILGLLAIVAAGCNELATQQPAAPVASPAPVAQAPQQPRGGSADHLASTVQSGTHDSPSATAVESALMWSGKYAEAVEKQEELRVEREKLIAKNHELDTQLVKLQGELDQMRKELRDANQMLREQSTELEKWRENVLGYRNEMRLAETAQIEALHKILKLLGAEVPAATAVSESASMPANGAGK